MAEPERKEHLRKLAMVTLRQILQILELETRNGAAGASRNGVATTTRMRQGKNAAVARVAASDDDDDGATTRSQSGDDAPGAINPHEFELQIEIIISKVRSLNKSDD